MSKPVRRRWIAPCLAALVLAACSERGPEAAAPASAPAAPAANTSSPAVAADGPCRLLTDAEVRVVFPDAHAGKRDRSREQYGIRTCVWDGDRSRFAVEVWSAKPGSVENEIRGLASGFIDPVKPGAVNNVRFEPIAGVGDQAFAVLETRDAARGILGDAAVLVTQRGDQVVVLQSNDLARRERGAALKALAALGRSAVGRLR